MQEIQKIYRAGGDGRHSPLSGSISNEHGAAKAIIGLVVFSLVSFVLSFAVVWVSIMGFRNPLAPAEERTTVGGMARSDSLRAAEMALVQNIDNSRTDLARLASLADSLQGEIKSRKQMVSQLQEEINLLEGKIEGLNAERVKSLSGIVAGLSKENLRQFTENTDLDLLVAIVLNASPRKARDILDSMGPKKAAQVAEAIARLKKGSS